MLRRIFSVVSMLASATISVAAAAASGQPGLVLEDVECPGDCVELFTQLDDRIQQLEVQVRGEPKSGTGTTYEWAYSAMTGSCTYLRKLYGDNSCHVIPEEAGGKVHPRMVFKPVLEPPDACPCAGIERVDILLKTHGKHWLPLKDCPIWHIGSIVKDTKPPCSQSDGQPPKDYIDLWTCLYDAKCSMSDESLQVVAIRDPRAVTVSTYFQLARAHGLEHYSEPGLNQTISLDDFFQKMLPTICMWTTLRYLLSEMLSPHQSALFWYGDHQVDSLDWHGRFLAFIGLNIPLNVVEMMAQVDRFGDITSVIPRAKGIDSHPGSTNASNRTFVNELDPESLAMMDDVMRTWLPPVLLNRFGLVLPS